MGIINKLIYLDRDFISSLYEENFNSGSDTTITKTEGMKALAMLPWLSAGVSSAESKSYKVSTRQMLGALKEKIDKIQSFAPERHDFGKSSETCWIEGCLSVESVELKRRRYTIHIAGKVNSNAEESKEELLAKEFYFSIKSGEYSVALMPTDDYFISGVPAMRDLAPTVIGRIQIPVKALVRVFSAQTSFSQWVAVPLVMVEP